VYGENERVDCISVARFPWKQRLLTRLFHGRAAVVWRVSCQVAFLLTIILGTDMCYRQQTNFPMKLKKWQIVMPWNQFLYILYLFIKLDTNTTCVSLLLCCYTSCNVTSWFCFVWMYSVCYSLSKAGRQYIFRFTSGPASQRISVAFNAVSGSVQNMRQSWITSITTAWTSIIFRFQTRSQNCEQRLLASCLSVRPSVCMEYLGSYLTDFHELWYIWVFLVKLPRKIKFH
jgi:hypothetical protein